MGYLETKRYQNPHPPSLLKIPGVTITARILSNGSFFAFSFAFSATTFPCAISSKQRDRTVHNGRMEERDGRVRVVTSSRIPLRQSEEIPWKGLS